MKTNFSKSHWPSTIGTLFLVVVSALCFKVYALGSPYQPGETLDPTCAPGETNCYVQILPSQTGNAGKFLTTDGSVTSWATVSSSSLIGSTSSSGTETFLGTSLAGLGTASTNHTVFIGINAGLNATSASYSNFLGAGAGSGATSANNSNFFGQNAGLGATGAEWSNFLGLNAGSGATGAYLSNFLGNGAGNGATAAWNSNFFGTSAGSSATSADHSVFIGPNAGLQATSADHSVFIGLGSGVQAFHASNSIFLGQNAGSLDTVWNNNDANNFSILIGKDTSTGGFSNSIAIGGSAVNTASNQFMLGSSTRPINQFVLNGTDAYFNFGSIGGTSGYGLRDNSGAIEFKNSGGSWTSLNSGGGGNTIYTADDSLTNNRTVNLNGNSLLVKYAGNASGLIQLRSDLSNFVYNDGANYFGLEASSSNVFLGADGGNNTYLSVDDTGQNININAANGVVINNLAGNGDGCAAVDNDGILSWTSCGGGSDFYSSDGTLTDNRVMDLGGNTLTIQDGSNRFLEFNPTINFAQLEATDGSGESRIIFQNISGDRYFDLSTDDGGGGHNAEIGGDGESSTLTYTADTHTFNGNVGIGATPSSGQLLTIFDGTNTLLDIDKTFFSSYLNANDNTAASQIALRANLLASQVDFRLLSTDGNNSVQILGNAIAQTISLTAANGVTIDASSGALTVNGSGGTCVIDGTSGPLVCASDQRLKTNITSLGDSLDSIMALRPVTYTWIDPTKSQGTKIGFIAQEVQAIFPQFVGTIDKNGTLGLDYTALITPTIKALQELNLKVQGMTNLPGTDDNTSLADKLIAWLSNAANHISRIFTGELCLTDPDGSSECLNKTELGQLKQLIQNNNQNSGGDAIPTPPPTTSGSSDSTSTSPTDQTPPTDQSNSSDSTSTTPTTDSTSTTETTENPPSDPTPPDTSTIVTPPTTDESSTTQ